ncbi:MAG: NAD(P)/FAD-dependent oxidoreductase [Clostridia bacterium]|nr:NAD(P)/FAD-dependent oxidoreductase [Clostridia bacterium]
MKNYDLIIVGGCSAGIAAAINAKRLYPEIKVAVIEKLPRIGKKLLATGNGKCNITNLYALEHNYVNNSFTHYAQNKYTPDRIVEFFESLGLLCYSDSCGRVYPESNMAASVVDALRFELERLGVEVICDTPVTDIKKNGADFIVNNEYGCKKIILAAGGKSSPSQGSDGSGYPLAKKLGHEITKLVPALVPLCGSPEITKPMKGMRVREVNLTLKGEKILAKTQGEVLFTDYGLSGIAAMELAATAQKYIDSVKRNPFTYIDFMPKMTYNEIVEYLQSLCKIKGFCNLDNFLTGFLPKAVGIATCKAVNLYKSNKRIDELTLKEIKLIAEKIKNFPLEITGTKGFANAQVTSGGIKTDEIDLETMQSKKCRGLYFAGEIIDVDGGCGGFNLQWAWSSGMLAGELKD